MKLTKKLEAEILKAYHSYWDSYLKGDMKTFASLLDEDCHIIGSTAFDVFDNKKPAVEFYTATAEQISDKGEFRNRKIKVLPYDENVMVQELHDFYFLQEDEWSFYGHGRVSTLFSKKEGSWKIIHQHGSLPDSQAEKGEQMGMEKISRENRELREAVKRRTVELEHKNYELEIESSLERVRTVAMAMQNPNDLLRICETVFYELEKLGFIKLRNAMINIHDDAKGSFLNYDFSAYAGKTITTIFYNSNPMVQNHVKQIKSSTNAFAEMVVTGKELADWREFRKENGEQDDPRLGNITSLYYYFYSVVKGDLGISNFEPVSEMQLAVLKRFSNVFDLAYKRYTDITKAEAQAREARIEAALEKVRSRTMAMQRSDELIETSSVLYHQLKELNEKPEGITIAVINEEENAFDLWITGVEGLSINQKFKVSTQEPVMYKIAYNSWKQQQKSLVVEMAGSDLTEFMAYLKQINFPVNDNVDIHKKVNTCAFFSKGYISIITLDLLPQETIRLLERFAGVFDQTYTRFLDLQKAEEQAREAKIEAALERTRTQSMLMQHSKELDDTLRVFHEQVLLLGIKSAFSFLWLPDESKDRHIFWAVWAENLAATQTVKNGSRVLKSKAIDYPLDRNEPATAQCLIDWKGDEPVVSYHVPP
ncbi:MAG: nuclear transport factor 2 family protein, partial [Chitinophagaceae bacterium]|nr:nuclear transport factor 2 family protein [Chitinophagaceae bacterium]